VWFPFMKPNMTNAPAPTARHLIAWKLAAGERTPQRTVTRGMASSKTSSMAGEGAEPDGTVR
jgi:hypothetical protein